MYIDNCSSKGTELAHASCCFEWRGQGPASGPLARPANPIELGCAGGVSPSPSSSAGDVSSSSSTRSGWRCGNRHVVCLPRLVLPLLAPALVLAAGVLLRFRRFNHRG
jgi:hypothetical protein